MKFHLINFSLFLLFNFGYIKAQNIDVAGVFPTVDHSGSLSNKLEYSLYYFAAFPIINFYKPDISKDANFHLFYSEQAITCNLTKKFSVTGSYIYQRANAVYDNYVNENRFYLQAKFKQSFKKSKLIHRLRFDGRFIKDRIRNETPFTHRLRYLLGLDVLINEKFYFSSYEEAFFNTVENATNFYNENWAYAGIGKKINEHHKLEAGILYVTWNIGKKSWFNQYYLQLTWVSHLDFKKSKKE
jgi:hypothetical protein